VGWVEAMMAVVRTGNGIRRFAVLSAAAVLVSALIAIGPSANKASAADFYVYNEADFIAAMTASATNGEDDVITIMQDFTWSGTTATPNNEAHDVTIQSDPGNQYTITYVGPDTNEMFYGTMANVIISHVTFEGFHTFVIAQPGASEATILDNVVVNNGDYSGAGAFVIETPLLFVLNSTFDGNLAPGGSGAAINATVTDGFTVVNSTFTDNAALNGGAISVDGSIAIEDSIFEDNYATGTPAYGGAVYATGQIDSDHTDFIDNSAGDHGGALYADPGAVVVDGGTFSGNTATTGVGGAIYADSYVEIEDADFDHNTAVDGGGAVLSQGDDDDTFILNTTFDANSAEFGGAIAVNSYDLIIVESTFTGNESEGGGAAFSSTGGIWAYSSTFSGNSAGVSGGALAAHEYVGSFASTFVDNFAATAGAIYNWGVSGYTDVRNSTFTGNHATDGAGAIMAENDADAYVAFSTFSANLDDSGTAANILNIDGDLNTYASVYVDAVGAPGCSIGGSVSGTGGGFGDNFDDDGSCTDDWSHIDDIGGGGEVANLGPLADNGGRTPTMLPGAGSDLVDAIIPGQCVEMVFYDDAYYTDDYDQRGIDRPYGGGNCDIGAVEVIPATTFDIVTSGGTVHVTATDATCVDFANAVPLSAIPAAPPAGVTFPFGTLSFGICVPAEGWTSTITLNLPAPVNELWKTDGATWWQVPGASIAGTIVSYDITDGGTLDQDGTPAFIVDPVAAGRGAGFTG
jgi:predicted outer membrane repeat protein